MATDSSRWDWSVVERESEQLRSQDAFGIPRPQRSLSQIEAQARRLRETVGLVSSHSERAAAAGLLQGDVDARALTQRIVNFQVSPVQEQQPQEEAFNVPEYLDNLAHRNMLKAIQARLDDNAQRFDTFLMRRMDADWRSTRHNILQAQNSAAMALGSPGTGTTLGALPGAPPLDTTATRASTSLYSLPTGKAQLNDTQKALAAAVKSFLMAARTGMQSSTKNEFLGILKGMEAHAEHTRMPDVCSIVEEQSAGGSRDTSGRHLLLGSLRYLEAAFLQLMERRVREDRLVARSGGSGSTLALLQGYILAAAQRAGGQRPSPQSIAWQQVYCALRSGQQAVAIAAAEQRTLEFPGCYRITSKLKAWLQQWQSGGGCLPEPVAHEVLQAAQAALDGGHLTSQPASLVRSAVLVLVVLSGSEGLLHAAASLPALQGALLTSIEDWLWCRCSLACACSAARAGPREDGPLGTVQREILNAEPDHYTRGGSRPLQYVTVLLTTLQYRRALDFLHSHESARKLRDVVPVLTILLHLLGMLRTVYGVDTDSTDAESLQASAVSSLPARVLMEYAYSTYGPARGEGWTADAEAYLCMLRIAVDLQLERSGADNVQLRRQLLGQALKQWVVHVSDVESHLDQERLALFVPDPSLQRDVLRDVAQALRYDEPRLAEALYALSGCHCHALEHLNIQLSQKLLSMHQARGQDEYDRFTAHVRALKLRANELKDSFTQYQMTPAARANATETTRFSHLMDEHWRGFKELEQVAKIIAAHFHLQAAPGAAEAAREVQDIITNSEQMRWLPTTSVNVEACVRRAVRGGLPQYERDLLPIVVLMTARAHLWDAQTKSDSKLKQDAMDRLTHVKHFAGILNSQMGRDYIPQHIMLDLNTMA